MSLAKSWGEAEPQAALDWAMTLGNRMERRQAVNRILGAVSDVDKGATLLSSLDLTGNDRNEAINAFANKAVQLDLDNAHKWIETLTPRERSNVIEDQLASISRLDPERARQLFDENMSLRLRGVADNMAGSLAKNDLPRAQAWVDSLPQGEMKDRASQGIIRQLQSTDPQAAAAYLDTIGLNANTSGIADNVARSLFDQDQEAALAWVESQGNSKLTRGFLSHCPSQDPAAAALYSNNLENSSDQRSALQSIMSNWANIDPEEAIAHYKTLKESDRPDVLRNMIGTIANTDIDVAVDFFESSAASMTD
ncbi:hypothetical protein N9260_02420 [bacterium]|nr:hypothetical protein [bacterium]